MSVVDYEACVNERKCSAPHGSQRTCNYGRAARSNHPINCVAWGQAETYCREREKRLPSEVEWEYAARGGEQARQFSWGNEPPDGRTCWKRGQSCEGASFAAGAFGLFDMTGNVWEWTADWYGPYPSPPEQGHAKVYRGGSWSRRFEKWLSPTLRNRSDPDEWGSHLGFRCAREAERAECPFGARDGGGCLQRAVSVDCAAGATFDGNRCVGGSRPSRAASTTDVAVSPVTRARSPEFDADCQAFQPTRPHAYRLSGGSHAARNELARGSACKNRDVGGGWNSVCCP